MQQYFKNEFESFAIAKPVGVRWKLVQPPTA